MGEAFFYHLTRRPLEATLPALLARARQAGWRVEVRGRDEARMAWLDDQLWLDPKDSFLPHGVAGGPHDADQPILLTTGAGAANDPQCVMSVDGAEIAAQEVKALDRVCVIFDGNDETALATARVQWKALTDAGCGAQYWSQDSGRWEMKAQR